MNLLNALQSFFCLKVDPLVGDVAQCARIGGRRPKKGVPYAALCLALAFFSGIAFKCEAQYGNFVNENFEARSLGNLTGQNDWLQYSTYNSCQVVDSEFHSGAKALSCNPYTASVANRKVVDLLPTGSWKLWVNVYSLMSAYSTTSYNLKWSNTNQANPYASMVLLDLELNKCWFIHDPTFFKWVATQ